MTVSSLEVLLIVTELLAAFLRIGYSLFWKAGSIPFYLSV
jgi:hypothetical protein